MTSQQLSSLIPFLILIGSDHGVLTKSPDYIEEKFSVCVNNNKAYRLLDTKNTILLLSWIESWDMVHLFTASEIREMKEKVVLGNLLNV